MVIALCVVSVLHAARTAGAFRCVLLARRARRMGTAELTRVGRVVGSAAIIGGVDSIAIATMSGAVKSGLCSRKVRQHWVLRRLWGCSDVRSPRQGRGLVLALAGLCLVAWPSSVGYTSITADREGMCCEWLYRVVFQLPRCRRLPATIVMCAANATAASHPSMLAASADQAIGGTDVVGCSAESTHTLVTLQVQGFGLAYRPVNRVLTADVGQRPAGGRSDRGVCAACSDPAARCRLRRSEAVPYAVPCSGHVCHISTCHVQRRGESRLCCIARLASVCLLLRRARRRGVDPPPAPTAIQASRWELFFRRQRWACLLWCVWVGLAIVCHCTLSVVRSLVQVLGEYMQGVVMTKLRQPLAANVRPFVRT